MTIRSRVAPVVAGMAALLPFAADAHVVITNMNQSAGWEGAVLTLLVPHGCGASPTTEIRMQGPENVNMILPEPQRGEAVWAAVGESCYSTVSLAK